MNPFSDTYCRNEIKKLNCPETKENCSNCVSKVKKGVVIKKVKIEGRCDDFLNVNFRAGDTAIEDCPIFVKDGSVWMSLTPMEIQSHYLPIKHGRNSERVATVGLGIGYFTVMVMSSPKVKTLDVYEIDQEVIELFKKNFSRRKGFKKVNFILGDFRETFKEKEYGFCFLDHYLTMLPDELIEDYEALKSNNRIKLLRPWGVEKCFIGQDSPADIYDFLKKNESNLKYSYSDYDYNERIYELLAEYENFF